MKLREAEEKESKDWDRERDQEGDSWPFFPLDVSYCPGQSDLKTQLLLSISITLQWIFLFPLYG